MLHIYQDFILRIRVVTEESIWICSSMEFLLSEYLEGSVVGVNNLNLVISIAQVD